jgi:hypothetical protein
MTETETETETATTLDDLTEWAGLPLDDVHGVGVGRIESPLTGQRQAGWLLARMGRFGHHTAVPARDAVEGVGRVWVPYSRDQIRHAPKLDAVESLDPLMERELLAHYGLSA